jgi:hypothetical protein
MKGDDVVVGHNDDDVLRTSVSQNRVTVTLCTEELFLRTHYIYLSPHIRQVKMCSGKETEGQHDKWSGPSWVSHLPAVPSCN